LDERLTDNGWITPHKAAINKASPNSGGAFSMAFPEGCPNPVLAESHVRFFLRIPNPWKVTCIGSGQKK
ncbi:MAG: hypothetical protein WBN18_02500, partial [Flavobacteriaceae bacterium]